MCGPILFVIYDLHDVVKNCKTCSFADDTKLQGKTYKWGKISQKVRCRTFHKLLNVRQVCGKFGEYCGLSAANICEIVREAPNCEKKFEIRLVVRICEGNGLKCDYVRETAKSAITHPQHLIVATEKIWWMFKKT